MEPKGIRPFLPDRYTLRSKGTCSTLPASESFDCGPINKLLSKSHGQLFWYLHHGGLGAPMLI